jgi:Tfp pilus assembly protein PilF
MREKSKSRIIWIYFTCAILAIVVITFWRSLTLARPIDQDYYTVEQYPENKGLLEDVDYHHTQNIKKAIIEKNFGMAKGDLDYTLVTFPNHPDALQSLWFYSKVTKSPAFAIPYFEKAISMFPQYAMTHIIYGAFLTDFGRLKEAERELKKAVEIDPNLAIAHAWLAKTYDKAGDVKLAKMSAKKAVELGYRGKLLDNILKKD